MNKGHYFLDCLWGARVPLSWTQEYNFACVISPKFLQRWLFLLSERSGDPNDKGHQVFRTLLNAHMVTNVTLPRCWGESRAVASGLLPESLNKDTLEGRSLVSRRQAVVSCVRGEVQSDSSAEVRHLPHRRRMCLGQTGGWEQGPSDREDGDCSSLVPSVVWTWEPRALHTVQRPVCSSSYCDTLFEGLGGKGDTPLSQDCFCRCEWDLRPAETGARPPRPRALKIGPFHTPPATVHIETVLLFQRFLSTPPGRFEVSLQCMPLASVSGETEISEGKSENFLYWKKYPN